MSIPSLFSESELDAQIAAYKAALTALAASAEYTMDFGGMRQTVRKADLPEIRRTLEWLQSQRVGNATGGGPQSLAGRVFRG